MEGAGSIIGAEGGAAPGLGSLGDMGALGSLGPVGGLGATTSASVGQASSLGTLSVPPTWAETVSSVAPLPVFDAAAPGAVGAVSSPASGAGISKLPLGAMVGRESDGGAHRIRLRPALFPRSPVAG